MFLLVILVVLEPTNSTVDRIDFSNDTATAVAKGPLSVARECNLSATVIKFWLFIGGGFPQPVHQSRPY